MNSITVFAGTCGSVVSPGLGIFAHAQSVNAGARLAAPNSASVRLASTPTNGCRSAADH